MFALKSERVAIFFGVAAHFFFFFLELVQNEIWRQLTLQKIKFRKRIKQFEFMTFEKHKKPRSSSNTVATYVLVLLRLARVY